MKLHEIVYQQDPLHNVEQTMLLRMTGRKFPQEHIDNLLDVLNVWGSTERKRKGLRMAFDEDTKTIKIAARSFNHHIAVREQGLGERALIRDLLREVGFEVSNNPEKAKTRTPGMDYGLEDGVGNDLYFW